MSPSVEPSFRLDITVWLLPRLCLFVPPVSVSCLSSLHSLRFCFLSVLSGRSSQSSPAGKPRSAHPRPVFYPLPLCIREWIYLSGGKFMWRVWASLYFSSVILARGQRNASDLGALLGSALISQVVCSQPTPYTLESISHVRFHFFLAVYGTSPLSWCFDSKA